MSKDDPAVPIPEHSRLSPSKAHTWTECTAALGFVRANEDRLPPDVTSAAASEGTKAHTVSEYLLIGKKVPKWATKEMIRHGKAYAAFCQETMGPKRDILEWGVEYRAPLYYLPSERGTVDFYAVTKTGVHLVDYKYGYDPVSSEQNLQMAIYARSLIENVYDGFWSPLPPDDLPITMTIFQPRLDGEPSTWRTTWGELKVFTDERITPKAAAILRGDPGVFKCSPKICKYCRAASVDVTGVPVCPTYNEYLLGEFREEVKAMLCDEPLTPVKSMDESAIGHVFNNLYKLEEWMKSVEKVVNGWLLSGKKLPGVKLVLSKGGHRRWTDPAAAGELLLGLKLPYDDVYPPSDVITPAQAEKLTDKMKGPKMIELQRLIVKPPGSPIAVPENDPRAPYENNVLNDFAGHDFGEEDFWG